MVRVGAGHIRAKNEASSRMLEYLDGIKNIKAHNLQGTKFIRLKNAFGELKRMSIKVEATGGPTVIVGVWMLNAGLALIMLFGISFMIQGSLSISAFLVFLILGSRVYDPLSKVLVNFVELSYYSISAKRIGDLYAAKPLPEPPLPRKPEGHDIEFANVWFHYHDTDVLRDVSFRLPENTMTALVGPSGSGKSTITRLIARFWDVNRGEVLIGGRPIGEISSDELMSKISVVFQDVYLFNDTVLGNIRVGRPDASMDDVIRAAQSARCHEFIERLPQGYDTMVGEGGATLSGGERQRISIARAILKNAPIVLLDEATASLDPENELYIQEATRRNSCGADAHRHRHRLSTITHADQILVVRNGEIAERGTHGELLAHDGGAYRTMWEEQSKARSWKMAG
ncbi:MAG: ABC transporter ATP-binding protein [Candidatus Competibacteraceae bacterium]|nr:ABC transporter ATP-binding protein [Candidatus Competibacteraceae bacterium]